MSVMIEILARTAVNVIGVGMALNRRVCASHSPTSPHSPPRDWCPFRIQSLR